MNTEVKQCKGRTAAGVRCRNRTSDASGYCPAHRNQAAATRRPARRPANRARTPAPVPVRNNPNNWGWVVGLALGLAVLALVASFLAPRFLGAQDPVGPVGPQGEPGIAGPAGPAGEQGEPGVCPECEVVIAPPVLPPAPIPPVDEQPQPGPTCQAWVAGETRDLLPGQTALGDVEAAGTIRYDVGGIGEGTIIVNLSSQPISIFAEWGAGCRATVDFKTLINTELLTTGCGGEPCRTVRLVIVSNDGVTEQFFNAPIP